jgi:hypothetical protein
MALSATSYPALVLTSLSKFAIMRYIDKIVRVQALASLSQLEDYAANGRLPDEL